MDCKIVGRALGLAVMGCALLGAVSVARADIVIETVPVGNPGNTGELSGAGAGGYGPDRVCGAVDHAYNIGKYEVTAGQYTAFLNAVAGVDTYNLYTTIMRLDSYGCQIERYAGSGTVGSPYQYRVAADYANRPVNYVSFWDACRFANWLNNGQGHGDTETGAYTLTSDGISGNTVTRNAGATWAVTSEDEWYKAAYYDPNKNGVGSPGYWLYPTSSDSVPSNDLVNPDPGNNATFVRGNFIYTVGDPYYRTEVGEFENSDSPYGTFDQGGNVWEWNDTIILSWRRGLRGGTFHYDSDRLQSAYRNDDYPTYENSLFGFRVSQVPEPASLGILGFAVIGVLMGRKGLRR